MAEEIVKGADEPSAAAFGQKRKAEHAEAEAELKPRSSTILSEDSSAPPCSPSTRQRVMAEEALKGADEHQDMGAKTFFKLQLPLRFPPKSGIDEMKPRLFVEAGKTSEAVDFYKKAFGAVKLGPNLYHEIFTFELQIGCRTFIISDLPDYSYASMKTGEMGCVFCLEIGDDAKAFVEKAVNAGAVQILRPALAEADGASMLLVKDPYGFVWQYRHHPIAEFKRRLFVKAPKVSEAVQFYKKVFGAFELRCEKREGNQEELPITISAELLIGDSNIIVSSQPDDSPALTKSGGMGGGCMLVLYLEASLYSDPFETSREFWKTTQDFVRAGALEEVDFSEPDGHSVHTLKDPYGLVWQISFPCNIHPDD